MQELGERPWYRVLHCICNKTTKKTKSKKPAQGLRRAADAIAAACSETRASYGLTGFPYPKRAVFKSEYLNFFEPDSYSVVIHACFQGRHGSRTNSCRATFLYSAQLLHLGHGPHCAPVPSLKARATSPKQAPAKSIVFLALLLSFAAHGFLKG